MPKLPRGPADERLHIDIGAARTLRSRFTTTCGALAPLRRPRPEQHIYTLLSGGQEEWVGTRSPFGALPVVLKLTEALPVVFPRCQWIREARGRGV